MKTQEFRKWRVDNIDRKAPNHVGKVKVVGVLLVVFISNIASARGGLWVVPFRALFGRCALLDPELFKKRKKKKKQKKANRTHT